MANIFGLQTQDSDFKDPKEKEINAYLSEETIPVTESPLQWWFIHQRRFQLLSKLAQIILAIPATSSPSEKVFSKVGFIVNEYRSSLSSSIVDKLVFLSHNKPKLLK